MAWDFRPGMRVVCVDDAFAPDVPLPHPVKGCIYTISRVHSAPITGPYCLELHERPTPDSFNKFAPGWRANRFRPLDERRIDCFRAHLAPRNVEIAA